MACSLRSRRSRKKINSDAGIPRASGAPTPTPIPALTVLWGGQVDFLLDFEVRLGLGSPIVEFLVLAGLVLVAEPMMDLEN